MRWCGNSNNHHGERIVNDLDRVHYRDRIVTAEIECISGLAAQDDRNATAINKTELKQRKLDAI